MTKQIKTEGNTTDREIVISRVFQAPRELVWEAMANPDHVVNWWGPHGFTTTIEVMEVKPGGVWKHVMHGPDGTDYPNHSVFTEIVKPERIVFVHGGSREGGPAVHFVSTWTFDRVDEQQTRVTIRMVFETPEARDLVVKEFGAVEGANQTLARLGEFLAPGSVIIERLLEAPPEKVWRAITEPEQMRQWFFPTIREFKAEVGFETEAEAGCDGKVHRHLWKVTEVVSGKRIAYGWTYPDVPGASVVTWELFAEGGKTRLRLSHTGLDTFDAEKNPRVARGNFLGGWSHFAGKLREFVEKAA
jgi:uncharacterized protein YndB with AHSA1/START domain